MWEDLPSSKVIFILRRLSEKYYLPHIHITGVIDQVK
jgi:hypothetical protein